MTSFSVDLAALEDAAAGINATMNDLRAESPHDIGTTQACAGRADVGAALALFGDRWQRGIENLAKDAQAIAGRLSFSVQDYLAAERDGVAAVSSISGMLEGTSDPAARR